MQLLPFLCLFAVGVVGLPSQATLLVGPGGLPQIRDAVALAAPGDVVLVQPGTYAHFACTRPITIRATVPGAVQVAYDPAFLPSGCSLVCLLSEGPTYLAPQGPGTLHVVGLRFLGNTVSLTPSARARHRVLVSSGSVHLDRCELAATEVSVLSISQSSVHLQDCKITVEGASGTANAVRLVTGSVVSAVRTEIRSNVAIGGSAAAGAAVELTDSFLHGSEVVLVGGTAAVGASGPALRLFGSARVHLADSDLTAGANQCPVLPVGSAVWLDRCVVSPNGGTCGNHPSPVALLAVARSQPLRLGQSVALDWQAAPFDPVFVYAAFGLDPAVSGPPLGQPLRLAGGSLQFAALLVGDAQGSSQLTVQIPGLAGLVGLPVFWQGVGLGANDLQLSPPVGGLIE